MGPITPILPLYNISQGPLYDKILRPFLNTKSDRKYRVAALLEKNLKIIGEIALQ